MTNMPLSPSPGPQLKRQETLAWLNSAPWSLPPIVDPTAVFSNLQQTLGAGVLPPDAIFLAIADAARVLTSASGTALALWTEGAIRCRARSGDIAPELGAALNVDSGISGECLRAATALRCDDTQTDDRVDPDVCRQLGVRSIAVVPVHRCDQTVGILEAFSDRPCAFSAEHMNSLLHLAEIVEAANERQFTVRDVAPVETGRAIWRPEVMPLPANAEDAALFEKPSSPGLLRYWIMGAAAVVLLLASAVAWLSWHEPDAEVASAPATAATQTALVESSRHAPSGVVPYKPAAGRPPARADRAPVMTAGGKDAVLQNAAQIETTDAESKDTASATVAPASTGAETASQTETSSSSKDLLPSEPPPGITIAVPEGNENIAKVVSSATALPAADIPISGGVTEAALIYKVQPVYPPTARTQRLEGTVVLEATIAEDGTPQDLRVISGPSPLAEAATAAVRQWRYRPSQLNGKPVAVQKQIMVVFKAP
jgi:TonB family protein